MRPLLTIVIPAYNGEEFLDVSIHSLINQRMIEEELTRMYEIIIVNDGSKDNTKQVAQAFAKKWNSKIRPNFIQVINKENGQYGSTINVGLSLAKGTYFKVLDCDDSFNVSSFIKVFYAMASIEKTVDVIFTDHTYEKIGSNSKTLQSLRKWFEPYQIININKQHMPSDIITMHAIIYRTDFLKDLNYKQIEGVYYSDSQYSLLPLVQAKTMYYINQPLYRYYIGRTDQSINIKVMAKNRSHQIIIFEKIYSEIKLNKIASRSMIKYAILIMKKMIQWQAFIVAFDKQVPSKRKEMLYLIKVVKKLQPKYSHRILNNALFNIIRLSRGFGLSFFIRNGLKIYAKFKSNVMTD